MRTAARDNQGERTLAETAELDQAVAVAQSYAGENATILVAGNLGIGGLSINGFPFRRDSGVALLGVNSSGEPALTWATGPNGSPDARRSAGFHPGRSRAPRRRTGRDKHTRSRPPSTRRGRATPLTTCSPPDADREPRRCTVSSTTRSSSKSWTGNCRFGYTSVGKPAGFPFAKTAAHRAHIAVAHFLQVLRDERGTAAAAAITNDPLIEIRHMLFDLDPRRARDASRRARGRRSNPLSNAHRSASRRRSRHRAPHR